MKRATTILWLGRDQWRIGIASLNTPTWTEPRPLAATTEAADAIVAAIGDAGSLVIALDAAHCLTATISLDDLPRRERRQAMVYRLEEKLPIAAEEFAASFIESRSTRFAFGIVTRGDAIQPLIEALAARAVGVEAIVPAAIVGLTRVSNRAAIDVACWRRDAAWEAVAFDNGVPCRWFVLCDVSREAQDGELLERLAVLSAARRRPLKVAALGVGANRLPSVASIESLDAVEAWSPDGAVLDAFQSRADLERSDLWIDLRQDALAPRDQVTRARRPIILAAACVGLLLLAIGAAGTFRAAKYEKVSAAGDRRLTSIYSELFPGTPIPVAIRSRLASEARLASPNRIDAAAAAAPRTPTATRILVNLLARVSGAARASIAELRIGGDAATVSLTGEALSFVDAQSLATELKGPPAAAFIKSATNAMLAFDVDAPRTTQRGDRSVSFSMNATPRAAQASVKPPTTAPSSAKKGKR